MNSRSRLLTLVLLYAIDEETCSLPICSGKEGQMKAVLTRGGGFGHYHGDVEAGEHVLTLFPETDEEKAIVTGFHRSILGVKSLSVDKVRTYLRASPIQYEDPGIIFHLGVSLNESRWRECWK